MEPKPRKKSKPKSEVHANPSVEPEIELSISASSSPETSVPPTSAVTSTTTEAAMSDETTTETQASTARPLYAWEAEGLGAEEKLRLLIAAKAVNTTTLAELQQKLARAEEAVDTTKNVLADVRFRGVAIDAGLLEFNIGTAPRAAGTRGPRVPAPTKDAILSYFEATGVAHDTIDGLAFHFGCSESTLRGVLTGMVSYGDLVTRTASELRAKGVTLDAAVKARTVFYARA